MAHRHGGREAAENSSLDMQVTGREEAIWPGFSFGTSKNILNDRFPQQGHISSPLQVVKLPDD